MAIPITCPGCKAGFEVPENLAGKTIRCTSCKTQLTVPAADARKPFGYAAARPAATSSAAPSAATRPAQPPVKAAPAKAVVAVDDDDDRKTSPSKPASKNGPTIKGAIKTGSKRRDDDDDDDDDDDRPRRKKAAKGAGMGGGAFLAILAGGVLCIGAIVGLSVWLLSDDSKDTAKDDTNNTAPATPTGGVGGRNTDGADGTEGRDGGGEDNGGGAVVPAPEGGGPGMRQSRPRPGGGNVGAGGANPFGNLGQFAGDSMGTPGEWAKHDGDGFSAEFPGTPDAKEMSTGGMSIKITAVGGKTHPVTGVMMIQLPAAIAQVGSSKQVLDQMMAQAGGKLGGAVPRDVTVSGHPGKELEVTQQGVSATMRMVLAHDRLYMFVAGGDSRGGRAAMPKDQVNRFLNSASISYTGSGNGGNVASGVAPGGSLGAPPTPGAFSGAPPGAFSGSPIGRGPGGLPGGGPGSIGAPPTPGAFSGSPVGRGASTPGGGPGSIGAPPTPGVFAQPGGPGSVPTPGEGAGARVGGAIGDEPPVPGGGGVPAAPGGFGRGPGGLPQPGGGGFGRGPGGLPQPGGGGLGQPGGGFGAGLDQNPAPFGSSTDGNMKANVDSFFTAVFDGEKKELLTFSARAERQITTKLNRFNLAGGFAKAGSFKIPNFVTRAAIDPNKGLLYVATVTRPSVTTLGTQMLDQAVGIGDVQIFDLNTIRDGKVKDGADFRPLATIAFGRAIRGLELSNDGKSLFVVSSTSGKSPRSFLAVYDTETRKPAAEPKTLDRPVWDMCKAPDGKHLLIVDMVESGNASSARMYDMTTLMEVKSLNLQGAANDLAATTGGQVAAPVSVNGNIKLVVATDKGTRDLDLGIGWKAAAKPGYVEFSSDGKTLFVSGHPVASGSYPRQGQPGQPAGFDVYEVTDPDAPNGYKKKASIRTAGGNMVGGHFLVSPDGEYIVFHTGVVLEAANIGGNNGEGAAGVGVGGGNFPGVPAAGGGFQPGGVQPPPGPGGMSPEDQMRRRGGNQQQPGGAGGAPPPEGGGLTPEDEQRRRRGGGQQQPGPGAGGAPPPAGGGMTPEDEQRRRRGGGQQQPGPGSDPGQ